MNVVMKMRNARAVTSATELYVSDLEMGISPRGEDEQNGKSHTPGCGSSSLTLGARCTTALSGIAYKLERRSERSTNAQLSLFN